MRTVRRRAEVRKSATTVVIAGSADSRTHAAAWLPAQQDRRRSRRVYDDAYTYFCSTGPDGVGPACPCYCVKFDPEDLWPGNAEPGFTFYADLYEAYINPAPACSGRVRSPS